MQRIGRWLCLSIVLCVPSCLAGCAREPAPGPADSAAQAPRPQPPGAQATGTKEESSVELKVTSPDFAEGERIPARHTADGQDASPQLDWTAPPEGTAEIAVICDDPDAPVGTWNHWLVYGLSPDVRMLPGDLATDAKLDDPKVMQGVNSFRKTGYGGPAPPKGKPHRYQFTVYALSAPLNLSPGASKKELLSAMEGKVLAQGTLEGTYSRQ